MMTKHIFVSLALALSTAACSSDPDASGDDSSKQGQSASQQTAVTGRLFLSGALTDVTFPVTATVTVRDVSYADKAAITIGTQTISITGPSATEFSVAVSGVTAKARYSVDAKVDANGDGTESAGDFTTQESYPVLNEHGTEVDITAIRF